MYLFYSVLVQLSVVVKVLPGFLKLISRKRYIMSFLQKYWWCLQTSEIKWLKSIFFAPDSRVPRVCAPFTNKKLHLCSNIPGSFLRSFMWSKSNYRLLEQIYTQINKVNTRVSLCAGILDRDKRLDRVSSNCMWQLQICSELFKFGPFPIANGRRKKKRNWKAW